MKLRHVLIFLIVTILLTACNFTLAADVTPPPGYVPPTPLPTLGPLYPPSAPDLQNGAAIYAEKCAPCHGTTGFGDGEQGKSLPVTVAAFALPETAHKATPALWFTTVTQGNIERFMPPFTGSLDEQDRWDVISYALTLHTDQEQIEKGKAIFEEECADCAALFRDQERMAALSANDLVRLIKNGEGDIPAFGADLSDEDAYAVAAYLRTLTFASTQVAQAAPTVAPVTPTLAAVLATPASTTDAATPSADVTPAESTATGTVEGTPQATPSEVAAIPETPVANGLGTVTGKIDNQSGEALPEDLTVTVRAFDHGGDPNAGPQEVATFEGAVEADGLYTIPQVDLPERRILVAEVEHNGIAYQSDFSIVEAGVTEIAMPDIVIYAMTDDFSTLTVDTLQIFFDYANADSVQVFAVYSIVNTTDKTVNVSMGTQQEVPFIKFPDGAEGQGYEAGQGSAQFVPTADGFAIPPSEMPYQLIAFANYPAGSKLEFSQTVSLPVANAVIFLPEGVNAKGDSLTDGGIQALQGANFHIYDGGSLNAGDTLVFSLSGKPQETSATADLTQNQTLIFGVGALGLVLIFAGVWMYMRDRNRTEEIEDEDDEFDDTESVLDAIIALDDLHRAGKLSDEAYHKRRDELKAKLKE